MIPVSTAAYRALAAALGWFAVLAQYMLNLRADPSNILALTALFIATSAALLALGRRLPPT